MNLLGPWVPLYVHNPVLYIFCKTKEKKIPFWMQELNPYFHSLKETYHP